METVPYTQSKNVIHAQAHSIRCMLGYNGCPSVCHSNLRIRSIEYFPIVLIVTLHAGKFRKYEQYNFSIGILYFK